jgi:hypothetical protein
VEALVMEYVVPAFWIGFALASLLAAGVFALRNEKPPPFPATPPRPPVAQMPAGMALPSPRSIAWEDACDCGAGVHVLRYANLVVINDPHAARLRIEGTVPIEVSGPDISNYVLSVIAAYCARTGKAPAAPDARITN